MVIIVSALLMNFQSFEWPLKIPWVLPETSNPFILFCRYDTWFVSYTSSYSLFNVKLSNEMNWVAPLNCPSQLLCRDKKLRHLKHLSLVRHICVRHRIRYLVSGFAILRTETLYFYNKSYLVSLSLHSIVDLVNLYLVWYSLINAMAMQWKAHVIQAGPRGQVAPGRANI